MPEGLSPSEIGKEISEHRHQVEERKSRRKTGALAARPRAGSGG